MTNQQLIDFIKKQLKLNVPKDKITEELLANGWNNQDITEGFTASGASDSSSVPIIPKEIIPNSSTPRDKYVEQKIAQSEAIHAAQPIIQEQAPIIEKGEIKKKGHLGRNIFFILLTLLILAGGAAAYYFKDEIVKLPIISDFFPAEETLAPETVVPDVVAPEATEGDATQAEADDDIQGGEVKNSENSTDKKILEEYLATYKGNDSLRIIKGTVIKDDTVCKDQNMFVVSASDLVLTENSLGRLVNNDGSFFTIVSKDGPQLLMLINDKKEICLSVISFPDNDSVVFDVKSTIMSALLMVTDEKYYPKIQELKSFAPSYQFMEKTLKVKTMTVISSEITESLNNSKSNEYLDLLQALINEVLSITKSN